MNSKRTIILGSIGLLLGLSLLLFVKPAGKATATRREALLVYCAAGLKAPVEAIARKYQEEFGTEVQLQFGGSGTLLNNLKVSQRGDLFLAADSSFVAIGRSNQLLAEVLPVARQSPVIIVPKANPKGIGTVADLLRPGTRVALANPDAAAVGTLTRAALTRSGQWEALSAAATVLKPTVGDVANDVKLGSVDAGIVWDATAAQYPDLAAVHAPELAGFTSDVSICVLKACEQPTLALHFARFLSARDRGLPTFASQGYKVVEGDVWTPHPEVLLYSGAVNRSAVEPTLQAFEKREGVTITRVYNGCGILTAQIRAGQKPDAYFACDTSFMESVTNYFQPSSDVSETAMVLLTQKGNPRGITQLADLGRPGLRVGLAHEQQSALGALTARLLKRLGLYEKVTPNVAVQAPTGDLLLNQLRAGGLDVALVYAANASQVRDQLDVIELREPGALAVQPYAVGNQSANAHLMERLLLAIQSAESRQNFERMGFKWRGPSRQP
jgi:molybdate transport system substrate-binding protein